MDTKKKKKSWWQTLLIQLSQEEIQCISPAPKTYIIIGHEKRKDG